VADEQGLLCGIIGERRQISRAELASLTGLSRATVSVRVDKILESGLIIESGTGTSTGGRRPVMLTLNPEAGVILAADLGATHCHVAVADLTGTAMAVHSGSVNIAAGPVAVLDEMLDDFSQALSRCGRSSNEVLAIGIGVPGPVEFSTGTVVRPPIMPGWDDFVISDYVRKTFDAPVVVDNDVNTMALGEYVRRDRRDTSLLFIKVGTGIGCGIMLRGELHRGVNGAAGDIGHIRLPDHEDTVCACGNVGCLEAVASGAAIARRLQAAGRDVQTSSEVVRLAQAGDPDVMHRIRKAGEQIGSVVASLVNFYAPETIIIGGSLAELRGDLLAAIRGVVYQRAVPLATRKLRLETTALGSQSGLLGAIELAQRAALSPDALGRWLAPDPTRRLKHEGPVHKVALGDG
jgi:predicted NBD/HSP70 family sugar kinase